jgi:hypothetical protein
MKKSYLFLMWIFVLLISTSFILAQQGRVRKEVGVVNTPGAAMYAAHSNQGSNSQIRIEQRSENKRRLHAGNVSVDCDCNLTQEQDQVRNRTKFYVHLNNGRRSEIKIMPNTASENALARLRIRVCNESNNCTIQLKETGVGNQTRAKYEMQVKRHARVLGIFKTKMQVRAQIDAETGEVKVKKPWWAFLAYEPEEDIEEETEQTIQQG